MKAWARVLLATIAVLAGPGAGPAMAAGTVEVTGGFAIVTADASVNCPPQGSPPDGQTDERRAGAEDFEAEVSASASSANLDEDCGLRTTAYASQETSVSSGGGSLTVTSRGEAGGTGTGEPTDDDDFAVERFDGESVVSVGFQVTGGPVEFSVTGSHSGTTQAEAYSQGVVTDPRTGQTAPEGVAISGVLQPGSYSIKGAAECTNMPGGTTVCPEASYSFTAVFGGDVADADGDALPDRWEEDGLDADGNGSVDLDLPAMGADPQHKDVFLEIDYMPPHALEQGAIDAVVESFDDAPVTNPDGITGIALHVDNGPGSVMDPRTGATWGARSRQDALAHVDVLGLDIGPNYQWAQFDVLKDANLDQERRPVFHYAISGHNFASPTERASGISRDFGASDFLVTLGAICLRATGSDCTLGEAEQAGTLMHELGHNLGLRHGGGDGVNYKPNYLSVMNYAFQFTGLQRLNGPPRFDYSRFAIALDERALNEQTGFGVDPSDAAADFATTGICPDGTAAIWTLTGANDFNCDGSFSSPVTANVNGEGGLTALAPFEDWPNLAYDGGLVGAGAPPPLPAQTEMIEPPGEELLAVQDAFEAFFAPKPGPPAPQAPGPAAPAGPALRSPPVLTGLAVRPRAFRATRRGARVRYRLSEAARVRFRVERVLPGRRRGRGCVAPRRAPRGRRCTRRAAVRGSFRHAGRAGANARRFTGRVGGKALRPGRYELVATPLAADGRAGSPRRARFRILR